MKIDPDLFAKKLFHIVLFGGIAFIIAGMVVVELAL